jgi:hypothetical protein
MGLLKNAAVVNVVVFVVGSRMNNLACSSDKKGKRIAN